MRDLWASLAPLVLETEAVYAAYAGGDVVDVGAFNGYYTYLLAAKTAEQRRTFVSVEPDPAALPDLKANVAAVSKRFAELTTVVVEEGAGDGRELEVMWPAEHSHPSFRVVPDGSRDGLTVDALVERLSLAPGLLKVDVEGAESFVLDGARKTLASHRPIVVVELHPTWLPAGITRDDVDRPLLDAGYRRTVVNTNPQSELHLWRPPADRREVGD
jgi:FkbM family methyltransferase